MPFSKLDGQHRSGSPDSGDIFLFHLDPNAHLDERRLPLAPLLMIAGELVSGIGPT